MRSMVERSAPDPPERPEFRMGPLAFALTPPPPSAVPLPGFAGRIGVAPTQPHTLPMLTRRAATAAALATLIV